MKPRLNASVEWKKNVNFNYMPQHFKKSELTSGYCSECEEQVDNLVIGKRTCADCLNNINSAEAVEKDLFIGEDDEDSDNDW